MDLEQIKALLHDRRVGVVAKACGLSPVTVARIRDGRQTNPDYDTVKKLAAYLGGDK